jgi:DNA repair exonuclease SbcCD ATPase subunit
MADLTRRLDDALLEAESRLQQMIADVQKLDTSIPSQRASLIADLEKRLSELDTRLNRMSSDVRNVPRDNRSYYEGEVSGLRSQYNQVMQDVQTKKNAGSSPSQRLTDQAASNAKRSQGITENLDEAIRLGNDSITTGNLAMATLIDDRQALEHIGSNLEEIDMQAQDGTARAKRMLRRACCNQFLAWIIVVLLMALLGGVIYWKATKSK